MADTKGMVAIDVPGDGNCMFHALSRGLSGADARSAAQLRADAVAYMRSHLSDALYPSNNDPTTLQQWIEWAGYPNAGTYLDALARNGTWGQSLELASLSQVLRRPIGVYTSQGSTCRLVAEFQPNEADAKSREALYVLYVGSNHYMALAKSTAAKQS
jgi:hypothetical protein